MDIWITFAVFRFHEELDFSLSIVRLGVKIRQFSVPVTVANVLDALPTPRFPFLQSRTCTQNTLNQLKFSGVVALYQL